MDSKTYEDRNSKRPFHDPYRSALDKGEREKQDKYPKTTDNKPEFLGLADAALIGLFPCRRVYVSTPYRVTHSMYTMKSMASNIAPALDSSPSCLKIV